MAERDPPLTLGSDTREQVARAARRLGVSERRRRRFGGLWRSFSQSGCPISRSGDRCEMSSPNCTAHHRCRHRQGS